MDIIIGIDDTDNLDSRGTGFIARTLGTKLMESGFLRLHNVSRHQLLVDSRIPYTSHNSCASLVCLSCTNIKKTIDFCRDFLIRESAEGSDVGLCVSIRNKIPLEIIEWGEKAKMEILSMETAYQLALDSDIFLEGLTGERTGVIGALAAVGLRCKGNDGRILWLNKLRELSGIYVAKDLMKLTNIDIIINKKGKVIPGDAKIFPGEWCHPVNLNNKITLIVEEETKNGQYEWKTASKEYIKSITE